MILRATTVLIAGLLLAACSGITPYQPINHREEGPPGGLFSGPAGAWSIGISGTGNEQAGHGEK